VTRLVWDKPGQRFFEAGIDRGVFYMSNDLGVAWNGLTSVEENLEDTSSEPVFFDGTKIMDMALLGDFAATLSAFTYPDELLEYEGIVPTADGLYVDAQNPKQFGLSYRTRVGNDVDGTDLGYRIHIIYNITAVPDVKGYVTQSPGSGAVDFAWRLTAVPEAVPGLRPTAHVILDSRFLPADILRTIEDILYGTEGSEGSAVYDGGYVADEDRGLIDGGYPWDEGDELPSNALNPGDPRIPPIDELIFIATVYGPKLVVPNTTTGLALLVPGEGDLTPTSVLGIFSALPETRLVPSGVEGLYVLVP
jgi:hypothetical protein